MGFCFDNFTKKSSICEHVHEINWEITDWPYGWYAKDFALKFFFVKKNNQVWKQKWHKKFVSKFVSVDYNDTMILVTFLNFKMFSVHQKFTFHLCVKRAGPFSLI